MKEEHKEIIELVICEFKKDDNGRLLKSDFVKLIEDTSKRDLIGKFIVDELFLVEVKNHNYLILTIEGWNFTTFKDIESKELAKELKENLEIDLAKSNLEANKLNFEIAERNLKSETFNKRMSLFNFIFVILNFCILIWQIIKPAK